MQAKPALPALRAVLSRIQSSILRWLNLPRRKRRTKWLRALRIRCKSGRSQPLGPGMSGTASVDVGTASVQAKGANAISEGARLRQPAAADRQCVAGDALRPWFMARQRFSELGIKPERSQVEGPLSTPRRLTLSPQASLSSPWMPCLHGVGLGGTPRAAAAAQGPRYVAGSLGAARRIAAARVAGAIRFVAGIIGVMD